MEQDNLMPRNNMMGLGEDSQTELMLLPQLGNEKIPNYKQVVQVTLHHFYITGTIEEPEKYLDLVQTLKTVEDHDTVFIYINSVGGNLYTTIQIINAMQNCNGTVVTCLEGQACSAAAVIFLAGQKHIVNPFGAFMVHKYSHGVEGKGNDVATQVKFTERYYDEISYAVYGDLMTKDEIAQMLDGKDFWFSSTEVKDRLIKAGRDVLGAESEVIDLIGTSTSEEVTELVSDPCHPKKKDKVVKAKKR